MKSATNGRKWALAAGAGLLAIGFAWWWWSHGRKAPPAPAVAAPTTAPVARVRVTPLVRTNIAETLVAYGSAVPAPGGAQTLSLLYEGRVKQVLVSSGQAVEAGAALMIIEPSPDARLQLASAQSALEAAREALDHVQQRFDLKLAANAELLLSRLALRDAEARANSLAARELKNGKLTTTAGGVVSRIFVQQGAFVPAGTLMAEVVTDGLMEIRLGIEPEDARRLAPGLEVRLDAVHQSPPVSASGSVRVLSRSINPTTRLVDALVTSSGNFILGEYVRGELRVAPREALVVPRSAVLPEGAEQVLFVVKNGRAVRVAVQTGTDTGSVVEILSGAVQAGDPVVTLGNYELADDMAVQVEAGS